MTRARFSGKKGSFEPSCEVNRKMLKSGVDPAILLHRYKSGFMEVLIYGFERCEYTVSRNKKPLS